MRFENLPSFKELKDSLISTVRPKAKSVYDIFDPNHLRFIFQLRVGLSNLRSHKFHHNFSDTLSELCLCGHGVEDTKHFLLDCSMYDLQRNELMQNVAEILNRYEPNLVDDLSIFLLYGHPSLNRTDNSSVLLNTINFIKASKRFEV